MESTAQYGTGVGSAGKVLEADTREARRRKASPTLHRRRRSPIADDGSKRDFPDAERLVKRLVARELILSFVPDVEQRLWRT